VVYLIGCDHRKAQTYRNNSELADPENSTQFEFKAIVANAIRKHHPLLVAEEMHMDILKATQRRSVAAEAAVEAGVPHRCCDPNWDEREALGIEDDLPFLGPSVPSEWVRKIGTEREAMLHDIAHRWAVREKFWIKQLGEDINRPLLFICGDGHRWTLRRRVEALGIAVAVIGKKLGAAPMSPEYFDAYRQVRYYGFPPETGCFCVGGSSIPCFSEVSVR
jgi:hypothetical protein